MNPYSTTESRSQWELTRRGTMGIISITGELSHGGEGDRIIGEVLQCVGQGETHLLLDLSRTTFVNASICGFIVALYKKCAEKSVEMGLIIPLGSTAAEVVRKSGIGKILKIYFSLDHFRMDERTRRAEEVVSRLQTSAGELLEHAI